jgi:hypothetical protein
MFAGVFFALQLASLRISWDLLRNTLGLGVLLFALASMKDVSSKRGFTLFTGLSLLCVFAHEYAAVALLFIVIGLVVWRSLKKQMNLGDKRLVLGVLPALSVFLTGMYLRFNPILYTVQSNFIVAGDTVSAKAGGLFFLVDYLNVQNSVDSYASYWNLAVSIGVLFTVLFVPYIILVAKGFFRNGILNIWTGLLLVGSFSALVVPFSALEYWHRWMFMLVYPFTFYAVYALSKTLPFFSQDKKTLTSWFSNKKAVAAVLITFTLGIAYLFSPILMSFANTSVPSVTQTYHYFSNSPCVPYQDVQDVVGALAWLNSTMDSNSCVLLQNAYQYWGALFLDKSRLIVVFNDDVSSALKVAFQYNYSHIYSVWWSMDIGWYSTALPSDFTPLANFERISVFEYTKA